MILYTSDTKQTPNFNRGMILYGGISLFCLIIFIIYDQFSHNVRSPYMTWLFIWPLVLGMIPAVLLRLIRILPSPGRFTWNVYNSGVAAVTVSSMMRGVFEIAGTASPLQTALMIAGFVMLGIGLVSYIVTVIRKQNMDRSAYAVNPYKR